MLLMLILLMVLMLKLLMLFEGEHGDLQRGG